MKRPLVWSQCKKVDLNLMRAIILTLSQLPNLSEPLFSHLKEEKTVSMTSLSSIFLWPLYHQSTNYIILYFSLSCMYQTSNYRSMILTVVRSRLTWKPNKDLRDPGAWIGRTVPCAFTKLPRWFWHPPKFENHWSRLSTLENIKSKTSENCNF